MATGGFNFGLAPAATTAAAGGFSFGSPAAASSANQPGLTPATQNTGFSLTGQATQNTGFSLTTPATQNTGFSLTTPATQNTGFSLTTPATTAPAQAPAPALGGFGFGAAKPAATTATASAGFGFGTQATPSTAASTPACGFTLGGSLGAAPSLPKPGGLFGTTPASTAATTATGGFNFAKPLTLGAGLATTSTGLTLGTATNAVLGGFGQTLGAQPAANTSIFGQTVSKPTTTGLGGADPRTAVTTAAMATDGSKTSDSKTVKEAMVQNEIILDIEKFKKYVKQEKSETEHIKRMSSTPMVKVQEDIVSLRQLLSVVSNGLQRNSSAVLKLKNEMTQELKNAEMAVRTKEIPPGLQYENTAPSEYFQILVENFENQMLNYRQQIEMLESHLASAHQSNRLTAAELTELLRKLHEAFIAMAAKLHQVHENMKTQKEHYLNYRKVFLGDNKDIFERQKKAPVKVSHHHHHFDHYGPNPFPGINDAAATAMASAMNRTQQPQTHLSTGPPVSGFSGFGHQSTGMGGYFPGQSSTQAPGMKGFGTGGGLFSGTTSQPSSLFGLSSSASAILVAPNSTLSSATEQPFQLNKPPLGTKRGKR